MKKNLFATVSFLIFLLMTLLLLSACGHEHVYGEWEVEKAATCTENGSEVRVCECGEKETKTIDATGHVGGQWITDVEACVADGSKHQICSACGDTVATEVIPARGRHDYVSIVAKDATCAEEGVITYTCIDCGEHYKESIRRLSHNYESKVKTAATCTKEGEMLFTCSECKDSYTTTILAAHTWVDATCTKPRYCSVCGEHPFGSVVVGHKFNYRGQCSSCGEHLIAIPKLPTTVAYYEYGEIDTACKIFSVTISGSNTQYNITIEGECTYNVSGSSQTEFMVFGYKIYDSSKYVIKSGTHLTTPVAVGEKFKETISVSGLDPNKRYTLEFLNVA